MKQSLASSSYKSTGYGILALLILTLLVSNCREPSGSYEEMMQAVNSLQAGMIREEAEDYLKGAMSHLRCASTDTGSVELYLFGSDDLRKADTIWALYRLEAGEAHLVRFANPSREFLDRAPYNDNSCVEVSE